jgi:GR25 family glycosyltransferase involved in LPS biosynthesis
MIDKIHVITPGRAPERYAAFLGLNPHLPAERFAAADQHSITREDAIARGILSPRAAYDLPSISSAMSHIALWERCIAEQKTFHISEDDTVYRQDFVPAAGALLARLGDWDITMWTANADWPLRCHFGTGMGSCCIMFDPSLQKGELPDFAGATTRPILAKLHATASLGAYSITPRGAARMLERCKPAGEHSARYPADPRAGWLNKGINVEMSRHYAALDCYLSLPLLAVAPGRDASIEGHLDAMNAINRALIRS